MYSQETKQLVNLINQSRFLKKKYFYFYFYKKTTYKYLQFFQQFGLLSKYQKIQMRHLDFISNLSFFRQYKKKKIGLKIFLKYTFDGKNSFKKILVISRNKQNILLTKHNLFVLRKRHFFANYIFYTNFGLLSFETVLKYQIGGILLFKIL